jgi:hypothetical protein
MYIIESDTLNYISCLFFIYCFFVYTPMLYYSKRKVITYKRLLENKVHKLVYDKLLYTEDLSELVEVITKREHDENELKQKEELDEHQQNQKPIQKYEDKYLEKFRAFPNKYLFSEDELEGEKTIYDKLKNTYEANMKKDMNNCEEKIEKYKKKLDSMESIINVINDRDSNKLVTNPEAVKQLLQYHEIEKEYEEDPEDFDLDELCNDFKNVYNDIKTDYNQLTVALTELTNSEAPDFIQQTKDTITNIKLDGYINNYILETTPLGNVYMRYNNKKQSFEYFSNSTIPYRYLETIGRKYVMAYWCKPLFVDLEEEINKAKSKASINNSDTNTTNNNITSNNSSKPHVPSGPNRIKKYTSEVKPTKNRVQTEFTLPSHIKANLPDVNSSGSQQEKQVLKESSNRYTWEGRIANLTLLKKVDKKLVDKNVVLSFADFKMLQKNGSSL